jgi:ribosome-binding ATPase YchF (GTP1/OBG family)
VVRCFEDDNVIHVAGKVDPIADIEVIQTELCLADLARWRRACSATSRPPRRGNDKEAAAGRRCWRSARLRWTRPAGAQHRLQQGRAGAMLKPLCLITAKPAMFVGNVSETGFENNPFLDR